MAQKLLRLGCKGFLVWCKLPTCGLHWDKRLMKDNLTNEATKHSSGRVSG